MLYEIIIALISITVGVITTHFYHFKQSKELKKISNGVTLYDVKQGVTNSEFYKTFRSYISNANSQVFITGRGLRLDSEEEKKIAEGYLNAFSQALKRAEIIRIQYGGEASKEWYEAFREIWRKSNGRLHFYVLDNNDDLLHSASIDPYDEKNCVGEIMMPTEIRSQDARLKEIAGSAIFIEGKLEIAQTIANRIASLRDLELSKGNCRKIESEEDWDELINQYDKI